jgi:hypothetical protein
MTRALVALAVLTLGAGPLGAQVAAPMADTVAANALLESWSRVRLKTAQGTAELAWARFGPDAVSYSRVLRWRPARAQATAPPSPVRYVDLSRIEVRRPVTRVEGALRGARLGPFSALARAAVEGVVCAAGGACELDAGDIARMALVSSAVGAMTGAIIGPVRETRWVPVHPARDPAPR